MRFLPFLEGISAVRGFRVASLDGELLAESGATQSEPWPAASVVRLAQELAAAGASMGLGAFTGAAVKAPTCSRLLAQSPEACALIELEPSCQTSELESRLRTEEWISTSATSERYPHVEIIADDPETLRPPPPAAASSRAAAPRPASFPPLSLPASISTAERKPQAAAPPMSPPRPSPRSATPAPGAALRAVAPPLPKPGGAALARAIPRAHSEPPSKPLSRAQKAHAAVPTQISATPAAAPSPHFAGSLRLFSLPDLLEFLRAGQRTGTLVCAGDEGNGTIQLRRGRIVAAATAGVPTLGELLVQRGLLSQPQLDSALQQRPRASLTSKLSAGQLVRREQLYEASMHQVVQVVRKMMSFATGEFTFDPAESAESPAEPDVDLDPQGVLLNIFKEMDDAQRA